MNFKEAAKEIAKKHGLGSTLVTGHKYQHFEEAAMLFANIHEEKQKEEIPVFVGRLNEVFGYNGFKNAEAGTEVFEFQDKYMFEISPLNGSKPIIIKFYKHDLLNCIDFLK